MSSATASRRPWRQRTVIVPASLTVLACTCSGRRRDAARAHDGLQLAPSKTTISSSAAA
ncbi:MAG TPA: hypothetical protein VEH31_29815 [Streptosporangiaceae bacterium]|nr:hypothetical protein [Streptosporangiaceae bacterium]